MPLLDRHAPPPDPGLSRAPATAVTMEPALCARRSTTVPMGTARARQEESPPVLTPLLDFTHALVTPGTLEMGRHVRSSTTVLEREEERMPAPAMLAAIQLVLALLLAPATPGILETGRCAMPLITARMDRATAPRMPLVITPVQGYTLAPALVAFQGMESRVLPSITARMGGITVPPEIPPPALTLVRGRTPAAVTLDILEPVRPAPVRLLPALNLEDQI